MLSPATRRSTHTKGVREAWIQTASASKHAAFSWARGSKEARIIVPKKALTQLSALLNSANVEHVLFAQADSTLFFAIGNRLLTCRQLAGKFPNYEAVLPREKKGAAVLPKEELFTAIQRVAQFSDAPSHSVRIRLAKDEFKISSSNTETGESEDVVQASYTGEPAVIAFNSEYLLEFLKAVESSNVRFEFKDAQSASELTPEDPLATDIAYRYVVMPVKV